MLTIGLGVAAAVWHVRPGHAVDRRSERVWPCGWSPGAFVLLAIVLAAVAPRDLVTGRRSVGSPFAIATH